MKGSKNIFIASLKVRWAYITGNRHGRRIDLQGRTYKQVYKKFGHLMMLSEYLKNNSWLV